MSVLFKLDINKEEISFGRIRAILHNEDNEILIKIEKYIEFSELPQTLKNKKTKFSNNILWLYENYFIFILPENLVIPQKILFDDDDKYINNQNNYIIKEILYKKPGTEATWITRHIKLRHFLPTEYIQEPNNPKNLPVKKIFLDLYFDDFGTYRTVYHSLGGVYIQFGNMPFFLRKQLKNHFIIGFVPFGASFNEFIKPFIKDIQKLEKGIIMKINNIEYLITGGLGVVTADLPQGNDLAGIKRHGANFGCRNCFSSRDQLSNKDFDYIDKARYLHQIKKLRQQYNLLESIQRKKDFATKYGLSIQISPFSYLKFNPFQQIPQDAYHAVSGKIARLMEITMDLLSESGKNLFIKNWKYFEFPSTWSKMPSPTSHSRSHFMSDYQRFTMIVPFILNRFLISDHIKKETLEKMRISLNTNNKTVPKKIIEVWSKVAICTKFIFSTSFLNDDYKKLEKLLQEERDLLIKVNFILFIFYLKLI